MYIKFSRPHFKRRRKNLVFNRAERHHYCVEARRKSSGSDSWLKERKEILQKIKDQVRLYLGDESKDLALYAQSYKRDIQRPWSVAQLNDIIVCLNQVQVVFGGDFHPFAQAQRAHLRLLRQLTLDRPVTLALECFFASDQKWIQRFLADEITEKEFLKNIKWEKKWGFPWSNYKPLMDFAKANKFNVLGLNVEVDENTGETLHYRDQFAADLLAQVLKVDSQELCYVIYGDLHIAENHLPKKLVENLGKQRPVDIASVYLNSEFIYFSLAEEKRESEVDVVQFNDRQFCILSSPPWVKWHSYLMYLEENFDIDLDADEDEWEFKVDHTDHVFQLVKMICAAIEVEISMDAIEVYSLKDPQMLKMADRALNRTEFRLAHSLVQTDRSFYVPSEGFFYLSKATVNYAATLAGQYVHAQLAERKKNLWAFPQDFCRSIWVEAMGYMLSKFVNPKRKAQTMGDLKKQLQAFDPKDKARDPLLLALDQKMSEILSTYTDKNRQQLFKPREKSSYLHAAKFLGEMLGERYFALYQKKQIDLNEIHQLLSQDLTDSDFDAFYFEHLKLLDKLEAGS